MNFLIACLYHLHSAHPFFLQTFALNTYRAAVRINHGTGSSWGDKYTGRKGLKVRLANKACGVPGEGRVGES